MRNTHTENAHSCVYHSAAGFLEQVANTSLIKTLGFRAHVVIDSMQAAPVWFISLWLGWEPFLVMQLFGDLNEHLLLFCMLRVSHSQICWI